MKTRQKILALLISILLIACVSMMMVACDSSQTYTITFDSQGGSSVGAITYNSDTDTSITLPTSPTLSGYTFEGWSLTEGSTTVITDSYFANGITADITLYAVWSEVVEEEVTVVGNTITYNLDGGTNNSSNPASFVDGDIVILAEPTKVGYTFVEWQDSEGNKVIALNGVTDNVTLTAVWQMGTLNSMTSASNVVVNGGIVTWQWVDLDQECQGFDIYINNELVATQYAPKYIVETEYQSEDFVISIVAKSDSDDATTVDSQPVSCVYQYVFVESTVTFVYNDDVTADSTMSTELKVIGDLPVASRDGYVFNGWYTSTDDGETLSGRLYSNTAVTEDITVYADWVEANASNRQQLSAPGLYTVGTQVVWDAVYNATEYYYIVTWADGSYEGTTTSTSIDVSTFSGDADSVKVEVRALGDGISTASSSYSTISSIDTYVEETVVSVIPYGMLTNNDIGVVYWSYTGDSDGIYVEYNLYDSQNNLVDSGYYNISGQYDEYKLDSSLDAGNYTLKLTIDGVSTYTLTFTKLVIKTPDQFEVDGTTLSWAEIDNADQYVVTVDGVEYECDTNSVTVDLADGYYNIDVTVTAYNSDKDYLRSFTANMQVTVVNGTMYTADQVVSSYTTEEYSSSLPSGYYVIASQSITVTGSIFAIDGDVVVYIAEDAFVNCSSDLIIVISGSTYIEDWSDNWNSGLTYVESDNLTYTVSGGNATITGIDDDGSLLYIPTTLDGYTVTAIADNAFSDNTALTAVILPEGLLSIGESAFAGCTGLTTVTVPSTVASIGASAFEGCTALTSITLPFVGGTATTNTYLGYIFGDSSYLTYSTDTTNVPTALTSVTVTGGSIGDNAFRCMTNITTVVLTDTVTSIGDSAFRSCSSLTSIAIPDSVLSIGSYSFYDCANLSTVTFGDNSEIDSIPTYAFASCTNLNSIVIPSNVTSIGDSAFLYCSKLVEVYNLSSLVIVAGSSDNGYVAYYALCVYTDTESDSSLYTDSDGFVTYSDGENVILLSYTGTDIYITIPSNVTQIYSYAFYNNDNIIGIVIPDSVTEIGEGAFADCSRLIEVYNLSGLDISINEYYVNTSTEDDSKISTDSNGFVTYTDGDSVILVAYTGTDTDITIPSNVTGIYSYAFYNNDKITSVVISDSVTDIGIYAFYGCSSLVSVVIPDSVTYIGDYAFYGCSSLVSVVIPDSVTSINSGVFYGCSSLTSVVIPDSVTSINAFYGCSSLTDVYYEGTVADWCGISFTFSDSNPMYYASNFYMIDDSGEYYLVTEIVIPDSVTSIGQYQFYGFSALQSVTIGENVASIGAAAFWYCTSLETVYYNATNATLGSSGQNYAPFQYSGSSNNGCSLIIGDNVESISSYMFYNFDYLTSVTIGSSVSKIGVYAFYYCSDLSNVYFVDTTTWYRTSFSSYTSGSTVAVSTSSTAATYLKSTYSNYYWYKI